MTDFSGKRALVVGGSGGIGAALSLRLAKAGATLVVHGAHTNEALMQQICAFSAQSTALVQPLSAHQFSALESSPLFAAARACDVLCVCYGPFVQKSLEATSVADWQHLALFDYALPGVLVSAALTGMAQNGWGRILLFGGTGTAHRAEFKTNVAYAGAKAGLNVLVQSVASGYADKGITCNAVLPGFTQTAYTQNAERLAQKMPSGRLLMPESIAEGAFFLLSHPETNGVLLRMDSGWSPKIAE